MSKVTVTLEDGLKINDETLKVVTLREVTAGDLIEATEESEKLVETEAGPQFVSSPSLAGIHMLRRQIVSVGDIQGPLSLAEIKRLTPTDLNLLQNEADKMESVISTDIGQENITRGRSNSDSKDG